MSFQKPNLYLNRLIKFTERLNYFLQAFLFEPQIDADPEAEWPIRYNGAFEMGVVEAQLVKLINVLLQTPEFQLM